MGGKTITPPVEANQVALDQEALGFFEIAHSPIWPPYHIINLSEIFTYFEIGLSLRR